MLMEVIKCTDRSAEVTQRPVRPIDECPTDLTHRSVHVREAPPSSGGIHTTNTCKLNIFYRHKCKHVSLYTFIEHVREKKVIS